MDYSSEKKEKLNRLEKKLYSRNTPNVIDPGRSQFSNLEEFKKDSVETPEDWSKIKRNNFDELAARMARVAQKKSNFINKIFIGSIIFFVGALLVAGFVFLRGSNVVSSKNVDIQVLGPVSIAGGQETDFDINIINNNNVDLNSVSLLVEYPDGARYPDDLSKKLDQQRFALENIKAGAEYRQTIKAVFFGEKDSLKEIKISLEYRVENSSALFYKEKVYEASISSAPIIVTPVYPKEINSNQDFTLEIEVASNSKDKIKNLLVNLEYPFGFVFKEASPKATFGNNVWRFDELNPAEKKTILVKGSVIGQNNEEKVFRITTGSASDKDEREVAVPLSKLTESIMVKKPFIGIDFSVDGNSGDGDATVKSGAYVGAGITILNNLPSKLFNASVEVSFKGAAFNRLSVKPGGDGFFQSINDTIVWDKRSIEDLAEMNPGAEQRLSFSLSPLSYANIASGAKPEINMTIKVKGERILESGSVEEVSATESKRIVLATDIVLNSKLVRSSGDIENSGPVPPRVNIPTTYTVVWSLINSFNQVSNTEVRATLPSYVKWTNVYNPTNESVSYNSVTNEVVWKAGSVLPNTGFVYNKKEVPLTKKEVSFQLEFLPSSSQLGQTPVILNESSLSGIDKVTGAKVSARASMLNINFATDPTFKNDDDKVSP
jgi:hypothetical protein